MPQFVTYGEPVICIRRSDFPEDMKTDDICRQLQFYIGFGPFLKNTNLQQCDVIISFRICENCPHYHTSHQITNYDSEKWKDNRLIRIRIVQENYGCALSFICHMHKQQYLDLYYHNHDSFNPILDAERFLYQIIDIADSLSAEDVLSDLTTEGFNELPSFGDLYNECFPWFTIAITQNEDTSKSFRMKLVGRKPRRSAIVTPFLNLTVRHVNYDYGYVFSYLVSRENFLALFL